MTWQPTKQQLEDAARAGGLKLWGGCKTDACYPTYPTYCKTREGEMAIAVEKTEDTFTPWQPDLLTTRGKAYLLDLMLALPMDVEWHYAAPYTTKVEVTYWVYADRGECVLSGVSSAVKIENNDKHAALAQAVLEVAAQVGAKMKESTQ